MTCNSVCATGIALYVAQRGSVNRLQSQEDIFWELCLHKLIKCYILIFGLIYQANEFFSLPAKPSFLPAKLEDNNAGYGSLPAKLKQAIKGLRERSSPTDLQAIIFEFCKIRPNTRKDVGTILNRSPKLIFDSYLKPMVLQGIV